MGKDKTNIDLLKSALNKAEETLVEIELKNKVENRSQVKRISRAVEKGYAILNVGDYSEREIDNCTKNILDSLEYKRKYPTLLVFLFVLLLSSTVVFVKYRTYSYVLNDKSPDALEVIHENEKTNPVSVNYKDSEVVDLKDGRVLRQFRISNDSNKWGNRDYLVNYDVYLVPDVDLQINDKEKITYKYSYKDLKTGKYYESDINKLSEVKVLSDGKLLLLSGTQKPDSWTDIKMEFGLLEESTYESASAYTFKLKVLSVLK